jgi:NADPH2:quinone reductase
MRKIVVSKLGGPEGLTLVDVPVPTPGPEQVVVRLHYAVVSFADVYQREGTYRNGVPLKDGETLPIGGGGAGVVASVGANVTHLKEGDRVVYGEQLGSYADYNAVPAIRVVKVPDALDLKDVAGMPSQGATAHYLANDTGRLAAGMTCLVHAAAGGVGHVLVQLAKQRGAQVLATVGSTAKAELVRSLGADLAILYREEDFAAKAKAWGDGKGVDVVYDAIGGPTLDQDMQALRPRGLLVLYGNTAGLVDAIAPMKLANAGSLFFTRPRLANHMRDQAEITGRVNDLFRSIQDGHLKPVLGLVRPLEQAAEVHRLMEARETTGRILLQIA